VVGAVTRTARDNVPVRETDSLRRRDAALPKAEPRISRTTLPDGREVWLVCRYADVARILQDHERFSSRAMLSQIRPMPGLSPGAQDVMSLFSLIMSNTDPPDHTRLRRIVQRAFTPRLVEGQRPYVQKLAHELLHAVEQRATRTGERTMDVVADYAFPLPVTVIMKLIGVPVEDRDDIRRWSFALTRFDRTRESAEALAGEVGEFIAYLRDLLEMKRRHPGDDLLSYLVKEEAEGDSLSELELVSTTFQLIFAGHETTTQLIGNGTFLLLTHAGQLERLKANPELAKPTVEELLRYEGPVELRARLARADTDIDGVMVRAGDVVLLSFASANRDPDGFEAPDDLDVARKDNPHLAFGRGIHSCFGSQLARMEGAIALTTLFRRMPNLQLAVAPADVPRRPSGLHIRGIGALPVTF
jgi:cytochrome P450